MSSKGKSKMSECFQRQGRKNFEFCSHKNCTLTHSSLDASWSSLGASLPRYLMDNLERPLWEGLDQGVPLPPIESLPSSPVLLWIQVHPWSPLSPPRQVNWSSSLEEDRSGRIFCQSERVKRKGQRCCPLKLSTQQRLRDQEKALRDLPQTLVSLALGGGSHQSEGFSQSCDKCWDLPCSYKI